MMDTFEEYASYREEYSFADELREITELAEANRMFAWTEESEAYND